MTDGTKFEAVRELTTGMLFKVGDNIACPCNDQDRLVKSVQIEDSELVVGYDNGERLVVAAPYVGVIPKRGPGRPPKTEKE